MALIRRAPRYGMSGRSHAPITIAGECLWPDVSGALYWPAAQTLVCADLHLEKGSAFARKGVFLPPYDSRATLARLLDLVKRFKPSRIVALGDSFHDREGPSRLGAGEAAALRALGRHCEMLWIAGNHDGDVARHFGGQAVDAAELGPLVMRHEPMPGAAPGELAGHLHPCAGVAVRGRRLYRRCFVSDGTRAILPAFGAFTGGLDVNDRAFYGLFGTPVYAWLIGETAVHALRLGRLQASRA